MNWPVGTAQTAKAGRPAIKNLSSFFSDDEDDSDIDEISEVPQEANGDADSDADSDSEEFMLDGAPETEVLSSD